MNSLKVTLLTLLVLFVGMRLLMFFPLFTAALALVTAVAVLGLMLRTYFRNDDIARLAADAEYQHSALLHGDEAIGVYGRFPPR